MVSDPGFGVSRVPQDLGNGQSEETEATILGVLQGPQKCGEDFIYSGLLAIWELAYGT